MRMGRKQVNDDNAQWRCCEKIYLNVWEGECWVDFVQKTQKGRCSRFLKRERIQRTEEKGCSPPLPSAHHSSTRQIKSTSAKALVAVACEGK